jgi:hypothetical protein
MSTGFYFILPALIGINREGTERLTDIRLRARVFLFFFRLFQKSQTHCIYRLIEPPLCQIVLIQT